MATKDGIFTGLNTISSAVSLGFTEYNDDERLRQST